MTFIIFLAFSLLLQGALGELVCDELPVGICSFSIASSGKRCLLETSPSDDANSLYQCKTSEVLVHSMREHIETDECIRACGVDRNVVGISSDFLLEPQFIAKLCSDRCYKNCPNIVDLYYNLALGEGVYLPDMCKARKVNVRRAMSQIRSSGNAAGPAPAITSAPGPVSAIASAGRASAIAAPAGPASAIAAPAAGRASVQGRILNEADAPAPTASEFTAAEAWAPASL